MISLFFRYYGMSGILTGGMLIYENINNIKLPENIDKNDFRTLREIMKISCFIKGIGYGAIWPYTLNQYYSDVTDPLQYALWGQKITYHGFHKTYTKMSFTSTFTESKLNGSPKTLRIQGNIVDKIKYDIEGKTKL